MPIPCAEPWPNRQPARRHQAFRSPLKRRGTNPPEIRARLLWATCSAVFNSSAEQSGRPNDDGGYRPEVSQRKTSMKNCISGPCGVWEPESSAAIVTSERSSAP